MYKYVGFYGDIYLHYFLIVFILSNACYEFLLLNDTFILPFL